MLRVSAPTDPLPGSLPCGAENRWAWSRSSPVPLAILRLVTHRSSQVPGEPIPYLCPALGSRPVHRSSPCRPDDAVPTLRTMRTLESGLIETQSRGFSTRCLRFKSRVTARTCKARFRSVVSLYRVGVEPTGFHRKVSILYIGLPPFPGLPWRYRKSPSLSVVRAGGASQVPEIIGGKGGTRTLDPGIMRYRDLGTMRS